MLLRVKKALFFLGRLPTAMFDWTLTLFLSKGGQATSSFMISFDDGPCPESTLYLLDKLKTIRNGKGLPVKAGFFLVGKDKAGSRRLDIWSGRRELKRMSSAEGTIGHWGHPSAESYPEIVRAIESEGHFAMVHSQHHRDLSTCTMEEMEKEVVGCYEALVAAGARPYRYFRPPYLSMPEITGDSQLAREGWKLVSGISSGDTHPWATESSVVCCCVRRMKRHTGPVALIFHDFRALPAHRLRIDLILSGLTKAGYGIEDFDPERLGGPLRVKD